MRPNEPAGRNVSLIVGMGQRIRARREDLQMTQRMVAESLGGLMDWTAISRVESGKRDLRASEIIAIAWVLDVDPGFLLTGGNGDRGLLYRTGYRAGLNAAITALEDLEIPA